MITLTVLSTVLFTGSYAFHGRIVNGSHAKLGLIPYIVSLQTIDNRHRCGGSILDETHILTAAHCIDIKPQQKIQIQYGVIDRNLKKNRIKVVKQWQHEKYVRGNGFRNDVAVLTLAEPIKFSYFAMPVILPSYQKPTPENATAVLAGWGRTSTDQVGGARFLQYAKLRVYTDDECEMLLNHTDHQIHICSGIDEGGKGQCKGDSGGPLYAEGKQIGIVSWSKKPCATKGYPGVFTKVSTYIRWIKDKMNDNKEKHKSIGCISKAKGAPIQYAKSSQSLVEQIINFFKGLWDTLHPEQVMVQKANIGIGLDQDDYSYDDEDHKIKQLSSWNTNEYEY